jgi:hypothetical protein
VSFADHEVNYEAFIKKLLSMSTTENEASCFMGYVVRPISIYNSKWATEHVTKQATYLNNLMQDKNMEYYPHVIKCGSRPVFEGICSPAQYDLRKLFFDEEGLFRSELVDDCKKVQLYIRKLIINFQDQCKQNRAKQDERYQLFFTKE